MAAHGTQPFGSLCTWLHRMRSEVLQGLGTCLPPLGLCCLPWAVGRVKSIVVANFLPLSCPLAQAMGHRQSLSMGE